MFSYFYSMARGHLDIISENLHDRWRTHPITYSSHPIVRLQQNHGIGRAASSALLSKCIQIV
jgi:hypothetical protein